MAQDYEILQLGDWELQSGEKIVDAHLAYKTFGDPKSPAIVYPTWFSGRTFSSGHERQTKGRRIIREAELTVTRRSHLRQLLAGGGGQDAEPAEVLRCHPRTVRQRPVLLPLEFPRTPALSGCVVL